MMAVFAIVASLVLELQGVGAFSSCRQVYTKQREICSSIWVWYKSQYCQRRCGFLLQGPQFVPELELEVASVLNFA